MEPERKAVEVVVNSMHETKFLGMEYFGSRPEGTRQASLDDVDHAAVYICVVGGRYGSGITQAEYRRAHVELGLPCLVYFKDEAAIEPSGRDEQGAKQLAEFKAELKQNHLVRGTFRSPDQLATFVSLDLHRLLGLARRSLLAQDALDFVPLIAEETRWYVGRTDVIDRVCRAVSAVDAGGYVSIVAEAGLGKTALAAELAVRLRAPAFFCSVAGGFTTATQCLRQLCAELVLRQDLPHDQLPDNAGRDAGLLVKLLAQARGRSHSPVVLVIDALDEAEAPVAGRNPLQLPSRLPPGCHIVTTQRDITRLLVEGSTRQLEIVINADHPAQRSDIEAHLARQVERPEIRQALASAQPALDAARFVQVVSDAAQGNFKYVDYLLADLASGALRASADMGLPPGLKGWYEQFWRRMEVDRRAEQEWDAWDRLFRPVLTLLATALEPVSPGWLADHSGLREDHIRARVLSPWRVFLVCRAGQERTETWQIVHKSFADFVAEQPGLDVAGCHAAVAAWYGSAPARWRLHAGYARRHASAHLQVAQRLDDLLSLVGRLDWYEAQMAADPGASLFVADVERAWTLAERQAAAAPDAQSRGAGLAGLACSAVTLATVASLAGNIGPGLVGALVRARLWTPEMALDRLARMPASQEERIAGVVAALAPLLPDARLVRRALTLVRPQLAWSDTIAPAALLKRLAELGHGAEVLPACEQWPHRALAAGVLVQVLPSLGSAERALAVQQILDWVAAIEARRAAERKARVYSSDELHMAAIESLAACASVEEVDALEAWLEGQTGWTRHDRETVRAALVARRAAAGDAMALEALEGSFELEHRLRWLPGLMAAAPGGERTAWSTRILNESLAWDDLSLSAQRLTQLREVARHAPPAVAEAWVEAMLPRALVGPGLPHEGAFAVVAACASARQVHHFVSTRWACRPATCSNRTRSSSR
jgi:hypothetical protein